VFIYCSYLNTAHFIHFHLIFFFFNVL